jgi:hypothetical protein
MKTEPKRSHKTAGKLWWVVFTTSSILVISIVSFHIFFTGIKPRKSTPALKEDSKPNLAHSEDPDSPVVLTPHTPPEISSRINSHQNNTSGNKLPKQTIIPAFRLCALTANSITGVRAGLVDKSTGHTVILSMGQVTQDGWKFVSADYRNDTATFQKGENTYTAKLESGPDGSSSITDNSPLFHNSAAVRQEELAKVLIPKVPKAVIITNFSLRTTLGDVSISPAPSSKLVALIQAGNKTFSIPSEVVQTMLQNSVMSDEQKVSALLSFPTLAEVAPGEDPLTSSQNATSNLVQALTPPTNTPSMEEFAIITQSWSRAMNH